MPFIDPQTIHNPATGNFPPASWGDEVRAGLVWCAGDAASGNAKPMCRVTSTSAQSVANATFAAVSFNAERYDVGAMHSTTVNTSRITIPAGGAGIYHLDASVRFASNATGSRVLRLRVNGSLYVCGIEVNAVGGGGDTQLSTSCDYSLAAGDFVEVVVFQSSGGALDVASVSAYSPEFSAHWVGVG